MKPAIGLLVLCAWASACGARQEVRPASEPTAAREPGAAKKGPPADAKPAIATAPAPAAADAPPPPPPEGQQSIFVPTAADQVFIGRMLDAIDEMAAIIERHQDACDRMATDLEGLMRRNQDLFAMAKQMKGDTAREKWMQDQAMPRLEKAIPRMMNGFQKCQNDAKLQALIRQLGS
jgi:hypothetical protein